ncbi:hypothetical protein CRE_16176 [Caenorhabditis remanei]|uniref:F-box domain-containing protein n=1 Tax=Caenorhabditis remanei TaxID=31234 RepID=E3MSQ4_CAERE|nr:hypothetical protein CRE_16176 [Caenorhabditis remanei]
MPEMLKTNPTALLACIFSKFLQEKNVEKAHKNFCKTVGEDVIEYVDFEYWFYGFYHGNVDYDHDRSADPEQLSLTDLPNEMLNEIFENLDIQDRINVRKVSRTFEKVVDRVKEEYADVSIYIHGNQEMGIYLCNWSACYKKGKCDCVVGHGRKGINRFNIEPSALSSMLTNSKSPIKEFLISIDRPEITPYLIESLCKDVSPIFYAKRVELDIEDDDYLIKILSLFKPGVLERFFLDGTQLDDDMFAKLAETDQFKQLKHFSYSELFPLSQIKQLSHLSMFEITMDYLSAEDVVIIRDVLLQFVNLKEGCINFSDMDLSGIRAVLRNDDDDSEKRSYLYPIPNSDRSLRFESYASVDGLSYDYLRVFEVFH